MMNWAKRKELEESYSECLERSDGKKLVNGRWILGRKAEQCGEWQASSQHQRFHSSKFSRSRLRILKQHEHEI